MDIPKNLLQDIFSASAESFTATALNVFRFQYEHNDTYNRFCNIIRKHPEQVNSVEQIPFLPIQFFKSKQIKTGSFDEALCFESSGTTGSVNSRHFVKEASVYEESFLKGFEMQYGNINEWCIIGLLPSYLERGNSSLVYMVDKLVKLSEHAGSGFYLYEHDKLKVQLQANEKAGVKTLLIGVTYALLDFAEANPMQLHYTTVMETGGMKGRREELSRGQVHEILCRQFGLQQIHSEYGMTELLSQAYSKGKGIFTCPPWMKVLVRNEDDPFEIRSAPDNGKPFAGGAINIIDLANIYSCSFIATDDAGKIYADGSFEITGRLDNSDIRGCGLMII
jgi:hypothetical protein